MRNSSANPENQKLKIGMTKSAITLTPPTVGRQSANLSADELPIKCQILALFSSADKNKIITTLLFFFPSADSFRV